MQIAENLNPIGGINWNPASRKFKGMTGNLPEQIKVTIELA